MLTLTTDITKINRVGVATARKLKRLGVETIQDLLFYFPFRYDDFTKLTKVEDLQHGMRANIVGQIELIQNKRSPRKRMYLTEALVSDETETVKVIWFNQPFIARNLRVGDKVSLAGKVEHDHGGIVMKSPVYEKVFYGASVHTQGLVPNYHLTANITQKQIRFLIKQVIGLANKLLDWLPDNIKGDLKMLGLGQAITKIHFPENQNDIKQARRRLAFNELFLIQLQSQLIKQELKSSQAQAIPFLKQETKEFVDSLPFKLTNAQRKAAWEILLDISKDKPMARLLEGDVGSGKTVVAVIAMLNVALNPEYLGQAVLMVPTEILAQQHFNSISRLLARTSIKIGLMTRSARRVAQKEPTLSPRFAGEAGSPSNDKPTPKSPPKEGNVSKKKMIEIIKKGEVDIVIGTHALIQENVEFKNLVLAIIDEQHRFGVEQRKTLINKSGDRPNVPHLLSMTATPIPRSLALALYGDLDLSILDEMPKGRKHIVTQVVPEEKREDAYNFIREQIKQSRQVFVICPLIDFSDKLGVKSVKEEYEKLDKQVFPDLRINYLHGRMPARGRSASGGKATSKEQIMQDFLANKINILVSTSVVEVGVDVANATIMMIEGAERFGLAQLHQFRGRVGRSQHQSYCFLFANGRQGSGILPSDKTLKRLQALVSCHDGFALAKMDLKFRGPGEVYGTAQKGFPELKIASLYDYQLMKQTRDEAVKLVNHDKSLNKWPELVKKLGEWEKKVHLE